MHFRLAPDIKARVDRAASITGQGQIDFAIPALSERADKILERHDTVLLDSNAYDFFIESLGHRYKPSQTSRASAARYQRGQRKGVR
jgi:uncharacterized protein (DUF1778 family)